MGCLSVQTYSRYLCLSLLISNTFTFATLSYPPIPLPAPLSFMALPPLRPLHNTARRFRTWLGGWVIVLGSLLFLSFFLYSIVLAKLLPTGPSDGERIRRWMDLVRDDEYFCLLVPLTLAPATVLGYLNWVAIEFYRAN